VIVFGEQLLEVQQKRNARRRTIYVFSFSTAAVLVASLIASSVVFALFHIDELPAPQVAVTFFAAAAPPPPPPPPARKKAQPNPKPVVQPTVAQLKQPLVQPRAKAPEPEPDREDPGVEGGVEGGVPGGVVGGVLGGDKDKGPPPPPPPPEPPPKPKVVPPTVLEAQKISGGIPPLPPTVKEAAFVTLGNQPGQLTAIFKVCVGPSGAIAEATLVKSSGAPALDEFIKQSLQTWRYRPYMVNGKPTPICGTKVFNVRLE
jgi:periplasmic protein TonB